MKHDKREYVAPALRDLGSVSKLTQGYNKIGTAPDMYSQATNNEVVGSLYNLP